MSFIKIRSGNDNEVIQGNFQAGSSFLPGQVVAVNPTTGWDILATATTPKDNIKGITMSVASPNNYLQDPQNSVDRKLPLEQIKKGTLESRFIANVTGGTLSITSRGDNFDLSDSNTVNVAASTIGHVKCIDVILPAGATTTTIGIFSFNQ